MLVKFTQSISKQELFHVIEHFLLEGKIEIETYERLVDGLHSFDDSREITMELASDKPIILI